MTAINYPVANWVMPCPSRRQESEALATQTLENMTGSNLMENQMAINNKLCHPARWKYQLGSRVLFIFWALPGPGPALLPLKTEEGVLRKAEHTLQDKVGGIALPHQGPLTPTLPGISHLPARECSREPCTGTSEHTPGGLRSWLPRCPGGTGL